MSNQNSILKDFLEMRKGLHKNGPPAPANQPIKGKQLTKTKEGIKSDMLAPTLTKIIEDKPAKKEVLDYFQKEADRLTAEKMK
jgi:hypothetical protein